MQLVNVVPLTNIPRPSPQVFSYYYSEPLTRFSLVMVPVGKKEHAALVVDIEESADKKALIRKAGFTLKPVSSVLFSQPVLFAWQYELARWMADYYWYSLGALLKRFIPAYLLKTKKLPSSYVSSQSPSLQKLVLVPDTSYFVGEKLAFLQKREGKEFSLLTSGSTQKAEFTSFSRIGNGETDCIFATKVGVFAPFVRLRHIQVYEELDRHHTSWDQRPKFSAVRVAEKMAELTGAKIRFTSTLPSLERYYEGISFVPLRAKTSNVALRVVDLTKEQSRSPFSVEVQEFLKKQLESKNKTLLYLNRRGEARFLLCRECGFSPLCSQCDLPFTYHARPQRILACHHCGNSSPPPGMCPQCNSHEIRYYGFGTERVQQELESLLPESSIFRLDSDVVTKQQSKQEILSRFFAEGNFLVSTSMILQSSTPLFGAVVILGADTELNLSDFRAYEYALFHFLRLKQLARKRVFVQTYNVNHSLFDALDSEKWKVFYKEELESRKALFYPPFSAIISLVFAHRSAGKALQEARTLLKRLERQVDVLVSRGKIKKSDIRLLGPAPSVLPKLRGKFRYHILIKHKLSLEARNAFLSVVPSQWETVVDPIDFM